MDLLRVRVCVLFKQCIGSKISFFITPIYLSYHLGVIPLLIIVFWWPIMSPNSVLISAQSFCWKFSYWEPILRFPCTIWVIGLWFQDWFHSGCTSKISVLCQDMVSVVVNSLSSSLAHLVSCLTLYKSWWCVSCLGLLSRVGCTSILPLSYNIPHRGK